MTGFFLPWNGRRKSAVRLMELKLYLPKNGFSFEDSCFNSSKTPYVSLPNPRGTLRSFLRAVETGRREEALGYFSRSVAAVVDIEEVETLFRDMGRYICFPTEAAGRKRTLSIVGGGAEIYCFRMIEEPDSFGKWKIYSIEKE